MLNNAKLHDILLQTFSAGYHFSKVFPSKEFKDAEFEPILKQLIDSFELDELESDKVVEDIKPVPTETRKPEGIEKLEDDDDIATWFQREKDEVAVPIVEQPKKVDYSNVEVPPVRVLSEEEIAQAMDNLESSRNLRPFGQKQDNEEETPIKLDDDTDLEIDDNTDLDADDDDDFNEVVFPNFDEPDEGEPVDEVVEEESEEPFVGDVAIDDMKYSKQISDILLSNDKELLALKDSYDIMFTDNVFVSAKQSKTRCIAFILKLTSKSTGEVTYKTMVYRVVNGQIDNVTAKLAKAKMLPNLTHVKYTKSDMDEVDRVLQARELDDLVYQYGNEVFPDTSRKTYMNILRSLKEVKEPGMKEVYTWFIKNF